jgi:3-oxoacyl-(acyl-carrier-protein) synthase
MWIWTPPHPSVPAEENQMHAGGSAAARPLQVISNKSCYGHTEGAAGLTGVLLAAAAASQRMVPPVMHLRSWNPHVAAALDTWRSQSKLTAAVPVQPAGEGVITISVAQENPGV